MTGVQTCALPISLPEPFAAEDKSPIGDEQYHVAIEAKASLREGFGYTPIEAALCKVPVICSRCEALPYSTQGLLNYYEPAKDYKALACKIDEVLNNPPSEQQLEKIAEKYKKDYSSERQLDLFKKVLDDIEE